MNKFKISLTNEASKWLLKNRMTAHTMLNLHVMVNTYFLKQHSDLYTSPSNFFIYKFFIKFGLACMFFSFSFQVLRFQVFSYEKCNIILEIDWNWKVKISICLVLICETGLRTDFYWKRPSPTPVLDSDMINQKVMHRNESLIHQCTGDTNAKFMWLCRQ